MDKIKYYPILKWKSGEKSALKSLTTESSKISPIIELVDYDNVDNIIDSFAELNNITKFYIDTSNIEDVENDYKEKIIDAATKKGMPLFPIFTFDEFTIHADRFLDICSDFLVKIPIPHDFEQDGYDSIFGSLFDWKVKNQISLNVLLDAGLVIDRRTANLQFSELRSVISKYLRQYKFDNVIVCLTSFPDDISKLPAGGEEHYIRYDIKIFARIVETMDEELKPLLSFSDYGVTKFTETDIDFSKLRHGILPKVRYTTSESYWVLKGQRDRITKELVRNYKTMAQIVVNSKNYYGEDFSYGDKEIFERAQGHKIDNPEVQVGHGNHFKWVAIAVNHHISVVTNELSNLFDS